MERRNKIIIAVVIAVLVILLIIGLIWFLNSRPKMPGTNVNGSLPLGGELPSASAGLTNKPVSVVGEPKLEASLKAIAATFAERFGSYSNEGNFSNLEALRSLMTIKMKAWVDNYEAGQRAKAARQTPYYGVTSQALSTQITSFDQALGRAEATVATQRQENQGTTNNPRVYYQSLKLQLAKTGDTWQIDSAAWQ